MATIKAPPIDTTDANSPDLQAIQVALTNPGTNPLGIVMSPLWSTFHVDAGGGGGGQYAYPTSSG